MLITTALLLTSLNLDGQQAAEEQRRVKLPGTRLESWTGPAEGGKSPSRDAVLSAPSSFVPMPPCRVADTRQGGGKSGIYGPPALQAGLVRTLPIGQSGCTVPPGAIAYVLNFTVVPAGPLSYLTVYPTGQPRPNVSTLNSFDGRVTASMAVVPAGTNGSVDVFVTDRTDVLIDLNGVIVSSNTQALPFRFIPPCRVMDTRQGEGKSGVFGPPLLTPAATRSISIPLGGCAGIPSTSKAYVLNITVVPRGPLAYLTVWPTGVPKPPVSTLNSFLGQVVANAVVVAAGNNAMIDLYASNPTDVIVDISGYLAP